MTAPDKIVADNAERASEEAIASLFAALDNQRNFKLEAGAGAGKTYSLIRALRRILENKSVYLPRNDQRVACLTYTKVARDEIKARTDEDPAIFADTLHGFLWEMISPYQKALRAALRASESWNERLAETQEIGGLAIEYDLGIRGVHEERITLHHNDIPEFAILLFRNEKFRSLITDRFPVIFIDEYQDTPSGLAEAVLSGHGDDRTSPVVGFFGDHWQQIYDRTCGSIEHSSLTSIPKNANFRSDRSVVGFLNKLRPELPQAPRADAGEGTVTVYHSNTWPGVRLGRNWKGQISQEATQACLEWLQHASPSSKWIQNSKDLKVLMLTHATIANELGYPSLTGVFGSNDAFVNKEDSVIEFLVDTAEPAMQAFTEHKYGELFRLLGSKRPMLTAPKDKRRWSEYFDSLISTSRTGTIGEVLDLLNSQNLFSVPTRVAGRERELKEALLALGPGDQLEEPRNLVERLALRSVPYAEIRALRSYLEDSTVFSTKHSVKGAEFDDVIVLIGRGWTKYDFAKMIAAHSPQSKPELRQAGSFPHSRNLFYVSASRAKHNLALLFVQELSGDAIEVLEDWAGRENVISIAFDEAGAPS
ncbi:UvrD-helicase domain-containing protein [Pseudoclavibacter sp. VKM Ac-2867]|uniref:UvrD-helicase domain-containing protein n=1 Tax=Pseudoclavibacter sp. VKM Ac-2867 TaxID=2783829 RepID=UPI00188C69BA|nr:UvrD-helicase domain-containing protein [Pseudoclavibacter sp. VKM Ac-2867]MBF4459019.1 ATP-dependent helicase [Pseudoclavibacter sp. VKM Ac-2867]